MQNAKRDTESRVNLIESTVAGASVTITKRRWWWFDKITTKFYPNNNLIRLTDGDIIVMIGRPKSIENYRRRSGFAVQEARGVITYSTDIYETVRGNEECHTVVKKPIAVHNVEKRTTNWNHEEQQDMYEREMFGQ